MLKHDAEDWFLLARMIMQKRMFIANRAEDEKIIPENEKATLQITLKRLDKIGLVVSAGLVRRAIEGMEGANAYIASNKDLLGTLDAIIATIEAELDSIKFIQLDRDSEKYYEKPLLFGEDVTSRFPETGDDIEEAGNCLALGRATASAYHLMRVMEVGLKELAKTLKIAYAPSWESYIRQIEAQIAAKYKSKSKKWKSVEPFYRDVLGDLQAVKIAWRNPTMHIVRRYTPQEAEDIFRTVRTLMQRLATVGPP